MKIVSGKRELLRNKINAYMSLALLLDSAKIHIVSILYKSLYQVLSIPYCYAIIIANINYHGI